MTKAELGGRGETPTAEGKEGNRGLGLREIWRAEDGEGDLRGIIFKWQPKGLRV